MYIPVNVLITHLQSHQFVINLKFLCDKISTNCSFILSNELLIYISEHSVNDPHSHTARYIGFRLLTGNANNFRLSLHNSIRGQFISFSWMLAQLTCFTGSYEKYKTWIHTNPAFRELHILHLSQVLQNVDTYKNCTCCFKVKWTWACGSYTMHWEWSLL